MDDFKTKKRLILTGLALLLAMDGALAYYNSRLAVRDENPGAILKAESQQVAWVKADVEREKNTYVVDSLGLDSVTSGGTGNQAPPGTVKVSLHLRSYFRKT